MFGRKKKPPPAVAVRITTTRKRKGKVDVVTSQVMEVEPLELPDDPVALVNTYRELRPQYENALQVINMLVDTMNQIADKVADITDGEIALKRVGVPALNPRSARVDAAKRLAAGLLESDEYTSMPARVNGAALPKSQADPSSLQPWRAGRQRNSIPETDDIAELYPVSGEYWDPSQTWQAQTPTPKEAIDAATAYVPPQGRISGSERPEAQQQNSAVAEIRAEGRDAAEMGLQNRIAGVFANVSQQAMAQAPVIQMPVLG